MEHTTVIVHANLMIKGRDYLSGEIYNLILSYNYLHACTMYRNPGYHDLQWESISNVYSLQCAGSMFNLEVMQK